MSCGDQPGWVKFVPYVIQWVVSVIAFANTADYSGKTHLNINCKSSTPMITEVVEFAYPFRLPTHPYQLCSHEHKLKGDFSIPAEFFMWVGVITFLYCNISMGVFAALWLVCSSMWARGVSNIKLATDPRGLAKSCVAPLALSCNPGDPPILAPLYASVALGFLCAILWIATIIARCLTFVPQKSERAAKVLPTSAPPTYELTEVDVK